MPLLDVPSMRRHVWVSCENRLGLRRLEDGKRSGAPMEIHTDGGHVGVDVIRTAREPARTE